MVPFRDFAQGLASRSRNQFSTLRVVLQRAFPCPCFQQQVHVPTPKKDLRGGRPIWADTPRIDVKHRSRLGEEKCDVAVVGAGISGALVALALAERGHDVVVVDRSEPCRGSTLASTAMIQFELDTSLTELADQKGAAHAERAYLRSFAAVQALGDIVARHDIKCAWKERQALYLAGNEHGWRALQDEAEYRKRIGLPSSFLSGTEVASTYGIQRTGAIISEGAAEVNPAQLAAGCLRAARRLGARLYSPHEITKVHPHARGLDLETAGGITISSRHAVFTTGYAVIPGLPRDKFEMVSTWAIATKPLPADAFWPNRCLIWEAADPYLYMRATWDNRIVAGGEDSKLKSPERRDEATPVKAQRLLAKVQKLLPGRDIKLDYAWAGAFADSPTGLPYIAPAPDLEHCFAVLGCGGNGITFSVIAAEIVRAWAEGKTDPDAQLFQ
jgi:glycine/D-amino acid oxidase-like deaminating enzyme